MQLEHLNRLTHDLERSVLAQIEANQLVVPSMSVIAIRCLMLLRAPALPVHKLVVQLEADPVLAALVLRRASAVANAPVTLLDHAVSLLEAEPMRMLVTAYAAHELFQSSDRRIAETNKRCWEHSVAVALLAGDLATAAGTNEANDCCLGGLLHDLGKPVLAAMMLEAERSAGAGRSSWIDHAAWIDAVGSAHRRVGIVVAARWRVPSNVTAAIRDCSRYDATVRYCAANVVRLADALAKREGFATGPVHTDELAAVIDEGCALLGLEQDTIALLVKGLQTRVASDVRSGDCSLPRPRDHLGARASRLTM